MNEFSGKSFGSLITEHEDRVSCDSEFFSYATDTRREVPGGEVSNETKPWRAEMPPRHLGRVMSGDLCCHEGDVEELKDRANAELDSLRAQLAERDALVKELTDWRDPETAPPEVRVMTLGTYGGVSIAHRFKDSSSWSHGCIVKGWLPLPKVPAQE